MYVRAILVDPRVYLIGSADGPVARYDDIDIVCHAVEQPQRGDFRAEARTVYHPTLPDRGRALA